MTFVSAGNFYKNVPILIQNVSICYLRLSSQVHAFLQLFSKCENNVLSFKAKKVNFLVISKLLFWIAYQLLQFTKLASLGDLLRVIIIEIVISHGSDLNFHAFVAVCLTETRLPVKTAACLQGKQLNIKTYI